MAGTIPTFITTMMITTIIITGMRNTPITITTAIHTIITAITFTMVTATLLPSSTAIRLRWVTGISTARFSASPSNHTAILSRTTGVRFLNQFRKG